MNETFTSQSGNFVSALQSHVDPRTGQFMVNLPLAQLVGNHQLGPTLSLGLSYSPLYTKNNGFGIGFSLGVTQFSERTNQLELSNGETYRVAPGSANVRNKKLDNFHFAYTNGFDDAEGYTIVWKEGNREKLIRIGGSSFVTSEITSPLGRKLSLSWNWNGQSPLLTKISDEQVTLCTVEYGYIVTMSLWPNTKDAYQIVFRLINEDQLNEVSRNVSESETLKWFFNYTFVEETQTRLLSGVHYPTGKSDTVVYSSPRGHKFPERSGIRYRMPAVLSLTSNPGGGQLQTTTYYEYTPHNFLGYNGDFGDWSQDSDYIYTTLTDYEYGSTETVSDGNKTVTTVRTYNNYHLQTSEKKTRQSCVYQVDFTYYAVKGYFIDSQPKQFQLMREKKETWTDEKRVSRTQSTLTEFDESGNLIKQVSPDGTETIYNWYAAVGEDGCPAEPNGFVRFMKQEMIIPRKTDYDAPAMKTKYVYAELGENSKHIVQDTVSEYADDVLIHSQKFIYNSSNGNEYGRIIGITDSKYEKGEHAAHFISRKDFKTAIKEDVMEQEITFTGHDGIQMTSVRIQSAYSGLLLSETDDQGVTIAHSYDKLGRPLKRINALGTDYEDTTTWTYAIEEIGPVTTHTDSAGNQSKVHFDGAGRELSRQRLDKDRTQQWFEVSSQTYDVFGEVSDVTNSDWRTDTNERYGNSKTLLYDAWGSSSTENLSDGTTKRTITNPVASNYAAFIQADNYQGGKYVTTFDQKSCLPLVETRFDSSGREVGSKTNEWDGIGRLRQEKDELDRVVKRSYDVYGRVLTQVLPDGTVVTRTYAPHLTGDEVSSISVMGPNAEGHVQTWTLGTQEFDSLGRVTKRVSGGRVTSYEYEGASPVASAVTLPSGDRLVYTYIPELGNAVSSLTAKGITQKFSYDKKTGQLLTAEESNSKINNTWSKSGLLTEESFSQNEETRKAHSTYTLNGKLVSYTDIAGKQMEYSLDSLGRVSRIIDEALTVDVKFDPLGRLSERKVSDTGSTSYLTTTFSYDDFGHEIMRIIRKNDEMILKVTQTWQKNGLLETRNTEINSTLLRKESYTYDCRNRLIDYNVSGTHLPVDSYGHAMTRQTYSYDALNNLTTVKTTLSDNTMDTVTYLYKNEKDPTQLTIIRHSHGSYPNEVNLSYDAGGRMISDEAARTLTYDVTGRLSGVKASNGRSGSYSYDALDRLITRNANNGERREFYYNDAEVVNETTSSQKKGVRLIKMGHANLGLKDESGLTLTATDHKDSLLWSVNTGKLSEAGKLHTWSPYGSGTPDSRLPGFNGERIDPVSGTYHLGNGYRAYNPVLMRFNCPDILSPFGEGGINPYAYCAGDPVNHMDPSGHLSWEAIFGITLGVVGLGLAVFTAGASIAAAGGVMAAISSASATSLVVGAVGVVSDVTAIVSGALEESNPEASAILGWVSLGTGLVGLAAGVGSLVKKGLQKIKPGNLLRDSESGLEYALHKFPGVENPLMRLRGSRKHIWFPTKVNGKYFKFGANATVRGSHVKEPLRFLRRLRDDKEIIIISGTHGTRTGANWVSKADATSRIGRRIKRWEELADRSHLISDTRRYAGGKVSVLDVHELGFDEFAKYVRGDYHVILAFCYGRNDTAYRYLLGLPPVTSLVRAM